MASAFSIHILLSPSPISRVFLDQKLWDFSHTAYIETERDKRIKNLIERYIPANKETVVTTQNTVLTSNLANRNYLLSFPAGAVSDHQPHFFQLNGNTKFQSEFVIIDLTRPLYLIDKGCGWIYGSCTIESIQSRHSQALRSIQERYTILVEHDDFFIFKKKSNTTVRSLFFMIGIGNGYFSQLSYADETQVYLAKELNSTGHLVELSTSSYKTLNLNGPVSLMR